MHPACNPCTPACNPCTRPAIPCTLPPTHAPCLQPRASQARGKFDEWALGYLTHLVFRVLHRRGQDEGQPSSYTAQQPAESGLGGATAD